MAKKETFGSVKRLGARYGRTTRFKLGIVEQQTHNSLQCPYCRYQAVKRLSSGIWQCTKCSSKFTGRAYDFSIKQPAPIVAAETIAEEPLGDDEDA